MAYHSQFKDQKEYDRFHEKLEKIKKAYTIDKVNDAQQTFDILVKKLNYSPRRAAVVVEKWRADSKAYRRRKILRFEDFICK